MIPMRGITKPERLPFGTILWKGRSYSWILRYSPNTYGNGKSGSQCIELLYSITIIGAFIYSLCVEELWGCISQAVMFGVVAIGSAGKYYGNFV